MFLLTDTNTRALIHLLPAHIRQAIPPTHIITIPAGDDNKNLTTLAYIWEQLTTLGATRTSTLINLGGGMVTDIGGLAAATFKRGIPFINYPTTLLAAVDAATGGKTAINFHGLKNEIGVFAPAKEIHIDPRYFHTLPPLEFLSGYAEMIKHALLDTPHHLATILSLPPTYSAWTHEAKAQAPEGLQPSASSATPQKVEQASSLRCIVSAPEGLQPSTPTAPSSFTVERRLPASDLIRYSRRGFATRGPINPQPPRESTPHPTDQTDQLTALIHHSLAVKERIVAADPTERGLRRALNLGHTAGHAFESHAMATAAPVPHGIAVAWGLVTALVLSHLHAGFPSTVLHQVAQYIRAHYPAPTYTCADYPQLLRLIAHDKKNTTTEAPTFTLLTAIGAPTFRPLTPPDITTALDITADLLQ